MTDHNYMAPLKELSYGEESTWGTAATTRNIWAGLVQEFKAALKKNQMRIDGWGNSRSPNQIVNVANDVNISLKTYLQAGKLFQYLMGDSADTGSNPYTHTMNAANIIPSITFVQTTVDPSGGSDNLCYKYVGCTWHRCTIEFPENGIITATFEGTSKSPTSDSKQTITAVTSAPYLSSQAVLSIDAGSGFASVAGVRVSKIVIDNNMDAPHYMGSSGEISQQIPSLISYHVEVTKDLKNSDFWGYIINNTEVDLKIVITRGANDTLTVNVNDARIDTNDNEGGFQGAQKENPVLVGKSGSVVAVDATSTY